LSSTATDYRIVIHSFDGLINNKINIYIYIWLREEKVRRFWLVKKNRKINNIKSFSAREL